MSALPGLANIVLAEQRRMPRGRLGRTRRGRPNLEAKQRAEREAMDAVADFYRQRSYAVEDVSALNLGWDLEASLEERELRIEVKGRSASLAHAEVTPNEYKQMHRSGTQLPLVHRHRCDLSNAAANRGLPTG